ncbi:ABC transporter substrate-binding protein [Kiloniella sp. EL199]|uniref:substrate-binding periplasmic protein n=1 Tax=Kiloniella sp. EL199 TaxID=2107581 RepID=UPI000EA1E9FE|nr:transporter substrate-binding domain-containing protein [Kiloniella sp. EL199]
MIIRVASILFVILILGFPAKAEKLVLACHEWKPLVDATKTNQGLFVDILKTAGKRAGYDIEHQILPWNRLITLTKIGEIDGISCSTFVAEHQSWLTYTQQAFWITEVGLFVRKDSNIELNQLIDLKKYTFGALKDGAYTKILQGLIHEEIKLIFYPKEINGMKMLIEKRFDILFTGNVLGNYILQTKNLDHADTITYLETLFLEDIHPAISTTRLDAALITERLSQGYKLIKADGTLEALFKKHNLYPTSYDVNLTN